MFYVMVENICSDESGKKLEKLLDEFGDMEVRSRSKGKWKVVNQQGILLGARCLSKCSGT